ESFGVLHIKEHYTIHEGRSITTEKRFDLVGLRNDFPNITSKFADRKWHIFAEPLPKYYTSLVPMFYTSYQARKEAMKHKWKVDEFPCLSSVWIKGVEVDVTPATINALFWANQIDPGTEYADRPIKKINSGG
ncbi:hypothetical protein HAX54_022846, partial [Datura stramonium]|nr:hypothetical protein [Datura stramonium]